VGSQTAQALKERTKSREQRLLLITENNKNTPHPGLDPGSVTRKTFTANRFGVLVSVGFLNH